MNRSPYQAYRYTVLLRPLITDKNQVEAAPEVIAQGQILAKTDTAAHNAATGRAWFALFAREGDKKIGEDQVDTIADRLVVQLDGGGDSVSTCGTGCGH